MILHKLVIVSMEVALTACCISQQFPHVVEECLSVYIHSVLSSNPLTSGSDSLHCLFFHSFWDMILKIVNCYPLEEFLVPLVSMLSLQCFSCFSVGSLL